MYLYTTPHHLLRSSIRPTLCVLDLELLFFFPFGLFVFFLGKSMDLRSGKHAMATADDASGATVNGVPGLTDEPHELASSAQENAFALASMAAKVDLGMMIFLAAVVSITTPTDPDNAEHTIAIVAAATASALIASPKGLFAKLLDAAVGWGKEPQTYDNHEPV